MEMTVSVGELVTDDSILASVCPIPLAIQDKRIGSPNFNEEICKCSRIKCGDAECSEGWDGPHL